MGDKKTIIPIVVSVGIIIILAMVGITFFTFRRIRRGGSDKESTSGFLSSGDSRNALLSTRNSSGWEKKGKKSKHTTHNSYGDTQLRTITQDVLDDEQTLEAMLGGEVFDPMPKGKELAAKTKQPRSNEVVTMEEVVPGSIRKLEMLTGAKVVPSNANGSSTLRRPPSVRTYDSRYSKRRSSHPTRLSTVNSFVTDAPEQLSPTFTFSSNYTSHLNPLSAPPVYNPSNWTGSGGDTNSMQDGYDFVPSQPVLPPHIISQHKGYQERRNSLSNVQQFLQYAERRVPNPEAEDFGLAMPEPVFKPRLAGERPDIQGHRRSWSGRSILLDLDLEDGPTGSDNKHISAVGRTPSPLSQVTANEYTHSRQTSSHSHLQYPNNTRSPDSIQSSTKLLSPTTATNLKPELSSTFGIGIYSPTVDAETDRIRQLLGASESHSPTQNSTTNSSPDLSRPPQAQQSSQYTPNQAQSIRDSIISLDSSACSISSGSRITPVTTVLSPTPAPRSHSRYPVPPIPDNSPHLPNSGSSRIRNLKNAGMHTFGGSASSASNGGRQRRFSETAESTISDAKSIMSNLTEKELEQEMINIRERARRNSLERKIRRRDDEMRGLY